MSTRDTIGILGGMGPKSTAPFLDAVIRQCQVQYAATTDIDFPPIMVYSLPTPFCLDRPIDHTLMERTIIRGLQRLEATGVAYIAMPCNSAHIYYEALARSVSVPLLNMISETVAQVPLGACVTLVATPITHESKLYQQGLERLASTLSLSLRGCRGSWN